MNDETPRRANPKRSIPPTTGQPYPPRFGEVVVPKPPDDDSPIPLADDAAPAPRQQSTAHREARMLASAVCPSCESNFPPDAVLCISCGFDRRTHARIDAPSPTKKSKPAPQVVTIDCPKCGYNLAGLTTTICPECGEEFIPVRLKRHANKKKATRAQLQLWVTPTIMLGIGSVICIGYVAKLGGGMVAAIWAIGTSFSALGGFSGYALIAANLTGWPYGIGNSLLRISGILMIMTAALILIPIPSFIITISVAWTIISFLCLTTMEMKYHDCGVAATSVILGWILGGIIGSIIISRLI